MQGIIRLQELYYIGGEEEAIETSSEIENSEVSLFSMMTPQEQSEKVKDQEPVSHLFSADGGQRNIEKVRA